MGFTLVIGVAAILGLNLEIGYYLHLIKGQAKLLWNRKPIGRLLKRSDLDPEIRARLEFVQEVRQYAQDEIGLETSRNYTSFCDIGDGPVSWQLTAAPRDQLVPLKWTYPVVGKFPYKGFFDLKRGLAEKTRLEAEGFDTHLSRVGAYSTLGWFDDPVLSTMLKYRDEDLAELIFHELAHSTVWVPDHVAFNESLATFIGEQGALTFLENSRGPDAAIIEEARNRRLDQQTFKLFMHEIASELKTVFDSELSYELKLEKKAEIFIRARGRFAQVGMRTGLYSGFPKWDLNNAMMLAYRTYHEKTDVFRKVYELAGRDLSKTLGILRGCERQSEPTEYLERLLSDGGN